MSDVAAVVLAAGASVRMGRNKLLLDLGGESVVRRAARRAVEAGMNPVVVVTGHEREAVEDELRGIGCSAVFNADHAVGQHTSVSAGIAGLGGAGGWPGAGGAAGADRCAAAVVVLADMPFVTAAMLGAVAARYRETGAPLVLSRYGGETVAPPMLYDRSLFGELLRMDRRCGREVVRRHRAEAAVVDWPAGALRDLDTPDDHEAARLELEDGAAAGARTFDPPHPAAAVATPAAPADDASRG